MRISQQKHRKRKDRLFNKDVADSNTILMTLVLILVSAGEVVFDDGGDDPAPFNLVSTLYLILPAIYFENPVDPHNPHDARFPQRSNPFLQLIEKY